MVEISSVHTGRFVLYMILFHSSQTLQGGRSEFGTFWLQEWLQGHLSSLQRGRGELIDGQMLVLGFSLESWSGGNIAGSPKCEEQSRRGDA